ncbi:MAG: hypothetical protein NTX33_13035 [Propionibacteriales bacterium]|nr:hypothetical protein [Propionibacteriales bacterium]
MAPPAVRVGLTRHKVLPDGRRRTFVRVRIGDDVHRLWFDTRNDVPFLEYDKGDLWVGPLMLVAMRRGENLRLADPISPGRRAKLRQIRSTYAAWFPDRMSDSTRIKCPPSNRPAPGRVERLIDRVPGSGRLASRRDDRVAAACFTGGVDSFHTLLDRRDELGAIVYAFGLDIPRRMGPQRKRVTATLEAIAAETDLQLLTATTNLREVLVHAELAKWGRELHGATLASLGTLFSPVISKLFIPSSDVRSPQVGWGSHPVIDPLWTSDRLEVAYHCEDHVRQDKVALLADEPLAQRYLRVCYMRFQEANCGTCKKCQRTMALLTLVGRLDRFPTFTQPLDVDLLASQGVDAVNELNIIRNALAFAAKHPGHDDIEAAYRRLIADGEARLGAEALLVD